MSSYSSRSKSLVLTWDASAPSTPSGVFKSANSWKALLNVGRQTHTTSRPSVWFYPSVLTPGSLQKGLMRYSPIVDTFTTYSIARRVVVVRY